MHICFKLLWTSVLIFKSWHYLWKNTTHIVFNKAGMFVDGISAAVDITFQVTCPKHTVQLQTKAKYLGGYGNFELLQLLDNRDEEQSARIGSRLVGCNQPKALLGMLTMTWPANRPRSSRGLRLVALLKAFPTGWLLFVSERHMLPTLVETFKLLKLNRTIDPWLHMYIHTCS